MGQVPFDHCPRPMSPRQVYTQLELDPDLPFQFWLKLCLWILCPLAPSSGTVTLWVSLHSSRAVLALRLAVGYLFVYLMPITRVLLSLI